MKSNPKQIAEVLIETYKLSPPINVKDLANSLGIEIICENLDSHESLLIICNGRKKILLASRITNPNRIRFSISHEIGHYMIPGHVECMCNHQQNSHDHAIEMEADSFAASLLMPKQFIVNRVKEQVINFELFENIAKEFDVSLTAAAARTVSLADIPAALIISKFNKIINIHSSASFNYVLPRIKSYVNCDTLTGQAFRENHPIKINDMVIQGSLWATDALTTSKWLESLVYSSDYNHCITLLIPQDYTATPISLDDYDESNI